MLDFIAHATDEFYMKTFSIKTVVSIFSKLCTIHNGNPVGENNVKFNLRNEKKNYSNQTNFTNIYLNSKHYRDISK